MTKENLDNFKKKRELLEKEKKSADNTIDIKQKTIEKEAENIRKIKDVKERMWGISKIYGDADEDGIFIMPQGEYTEFINPLHQVTVSGASIFGVERQSNVTFMRTEEHAAILGAVSSTAGSAIPHALNVMKEYPTYFKNPEVIIKEVKAVNESSKQIDYIKSQLSLITPDISEDFNIFLKKYDSFKKDKAKYQDFIAARSMLFFKLIFEPIQYAISGRKRQIRFFVLGKDTIVNSIEPQIIVAHNLYIELSSPKWGVKTGELDPAKVDDLFNRVIAVLYSLLVLREKYFK